MGRHMSNLAHQKFGMLTALYPSGLVERGNRCIKWLCRCDCGNFHIVNSNNLKRGQVKSCGCLKRKPASAAYSLPNIYIEGPDATGKSTLTQYLQATYGYNVIHLTNKTPNTYLFHKNLISNCSNTVFDRFCLGEFVYPRIYARHPKLSYVQCISLIKHAVSSNGIFILLTTKKPQILNTRLKNRGEIDNLWEISLQLWLYRRFCDFQHPHYIVHYIENGYDDLYKKIDEKVKEYQHV